MGNFCELNRFALGCCIIVVFWGTSACLSAQDVMPIAERGNTDEVTVPGESSALGRTPDSRILTADSKRPSRIEQARAPKRAKLISERPSTLPPNGYHLRGELFGSFLSDVASQSLLQITFGYGFHGGYRWDQWAAFVKLEHNLWVASELSKSVERGALNLGFGVEFSYFDNQAHSSIAVGPSVLIFDTGIDDAGDVGLFLDVRPVGLRWSFGHMVVQWDPLTFAIVAPVLDGIPLVLVQYRSVLSVEYDFVERSK